MTRPTAHCAPVRRSADTIHSDGRLSFVRSGVHDSSAEISVLASSFRLPSLSVKLFASLLTSDGGGASATNVGRTYARCALQSPDAAPDLRARRGPDRPQCRDSFCRSPSV